MTESNVTNVLNFLSSRSKIGPKSLFLKTSFLTPPFGFALFYLKGIAPKEVKIQEIYKGIIPFVLLQLIGLILVMWKYQVK